MGKMAYNLCLWELLILGCSLLALSAMSEDDPPEYMSKEEREALKEEARDMFYHAYNAYMDNAYPADELMPLSCKGRYRGSEPNRGDIDSTLGNFSLTLVDTLDTLVVLGDLEEFENAVKLVARDVSFDTDVIVSLFETNIRMLGGLLSGHILAEYLQQRADIMPWYRGELLSLAKDLGYRFLPAFNTTTGIPYGRINLKYGMKGVPMEVSRETCTACAGSMILEMAALSRLTGESIFEEKAQKAMDVLWRMRHRGTDLMGSVLNVNSGDWVRRDSGVGAGIDSYYEYCLKAYILLGDEKYLGRFNKHYEAVMKYVSQGPMLLDVHMHRPNTNSKNFMDALLAFWPGLQVLKGDIKPAVETHEMLYQVMQRHNFIPEAFTTDFQVHWGHHPLRPEFLESTYFLYRATGDHYYLGVGRKVLKSLQTYARVPCGYAAVSDVRTNKHDDTMDSFVLSETFKYLFLLFAEPSELVLDLDEFIFTTEGHLLPLTLASIRTNISSEFERDVVHVDEMDRTCPNSLHLFPASVRQPLRNMVEDVCPRRTIKRRLSAAQFQANNLEHLKMLSDMGITTLTLADGHVRLLHTFSNAKTPRDSEEGLLFMQEMVEISKVQAQQAETKPQIVTFIKTKTNPSQKVTLLAGPADFGLDLRTLNEITAKVVFAFPPTACTDLGNANQIAGKIAIMLRGNCMFIEKARRIQQAGAVAGVVLDSVEGSSAANSPMFVMSGDGNTADDVMIPVVFLFSTEAIELVKAYLDSSSDLTVSLGNFISKEEIQLKAPTDSSMFERLQGSLNSFLSRQASPQTSPSTGTNVDSVTTPESKSDDAKKNVVDYYNLHAEVLEDPLDGEVRITSSCVPPRNTDKSKAPNLIEERWYELREIFANSVYSEAQEKAGLQMRTYILESYYNWISKERGISDESFKASLREKILWFLKELSEVPPNPTISKMDQLDEANKVRLWREIFFTRLDTTTLKSKAIATLLKSQLSENGALRRLRSIVDRINTAHSKQVNMLLRQVHSVSNNPSPADDLFFEHLKKVLRFKEALDEEYDEILQQLSSSSQTASDENEEDLSRSAQSVEKISELKNADQVPSAILVENLQKSIQSYKVLDSLKKVLDDELSGFMADMSDHSKSGSKGREPAKIKPVKLYERNIEKLEEHEQFLFEVLNAARAYVDGFDYTQNNHENYLDIFDTAKISAEQANDENTESKKVVINASPKNQSEREKFMSRLNRLKYNIEYLKKFQDVLKNMESLTDLRKNADTLLDLAIDNLKIKDSITSGKQAGGQTPEETAIAGDTENNEASHRVALKEGGTMRDQVLLDEEHSTSNTAESDKVILKRDQSRLPDELVKEVSPVLGVAEKEKEKRSSGFRGDMGVPDGDHKAVENNEVDRQRKYVAKDGNVKAIMNSVKKRRTVVDEVFDHISKIESIETIMNSRKKRKHIADEL